MTRTTVNEQKNEAIKLRKKGLSYRKIEGELNIPRSTLSNWLKNKNWSRDLKNKLNKKNNQDYSERIKKLAIINKKKNEERRQKWRESAKNEFARLAKNKLFIAGAMIYDGEGDKTARNGLVRIGNTNPQMIRLFIKSEVDDIAVTDDIFFPLQPQQSLLFCLGESA